MNTAAMNTAAHIARQASAAKSRALEYSAGSRWREADLVEAGTLSAIALRLGELPEQQHGAFLDRQEALLEQQGAHGPLASLRLARMEAGQVSA